MLSSPYFFYKKGGDYEMITNKTIAHNDKHKSTAINAIKIARNRLLNTIDTKKDKISAELLEESINTIITDSENIHQELMETILEKMPMIQNHAAAEFQVTGTGALNIDFAKDTAANAVLAEARKKYYEYKDIIESGIESTITQDDLTTAYKTMQSIQGQTSLVKGQLAESFVQVILPYIKNTLAEVGEGGIQQALLDGLGTFAAELKLADTSKFKTTGAISLQSDSKQTKISSQQKSDVIFDDTGYSVKNYANLSKAISIVGSANVIGMIQQWGVGQQTLKYVQGTLVHHDNCDVTPWHSVDGVRQMLILQAFVGQKGKDEVKSKYLILFNRSSKKQPCNVLPIGEYIDSITNIKGVVQMQWSTEPPVNDAVDLNDLKLSVSAKLTATLLKNLKKGKIA